MQRRGQGLLLEAQIWPHEVLPPLVPSSCGHKLVRGPHRHKQTVGASRPSSLVPTRPRQPICTYLATSQEPSSVLGSVRRAPSPPRETDGPAVGANPSVSSLSLSVSLSLLATPDFAAQSNWRTKQGRGSYLLEFMIYFRAQHESTNKQTLMASVDRIRWSVEGICTHQQETKVY